MNRSNRWRWSDVSHAVDQVRADRLRTRQGRFLSPKPGKPHVNSSYGRQNFLKKTNKQTKTADWIEKTPRKPANITGENVISSP